MSDTHRNHEMTHVANLVKAGLEVWRCLCGHVELVPYDKAYDSETDEHVEKK